HLRQLLTGLASPYGPASPLQAGKRRGQGRLARAFTLMELMVVILIISILAAMIVPHLLAKADQAKVAKAKSDIAALSSALTNYRIDNDKFPTTEEGLQALISPPSDAPNWKGPYIEKLYNDPWSNPYVYVSPGPSGEDFLITSYGSDGQPGGEGTAADITSDDN
ncbi:MAG: type II secretion system major pseudopilin GspG, partial [Capsulimonadaceae bacterium]